jgi:hypothetical protein
MVAAGPVPPPPGGKNYVPPNSPETTTTLQQINDRVEKGAKEVQDTGPTFTQYSSPHSEGEYSIPDPIRTRPGRPMYLNFPNMEILGGYMVWLMQEEPILAKEYESTFGRMFAKHYGIWRDQKDQRE